MLLQLVTPDYKLPLISFPQLSSNLLQKNTPDYKSIPNVRPPLFISREIQNHFPRTLYYFKNRVCDVISEQ